MKIDFDVPRQPVHSALMEFAEQADLTLVFPDDVVRDKSANALTGRYSLQQGADILLAGTGLAPVFSNETVLSISADGQLTNEGNAMNTDAARTRAPLLQRLGSAVAAALFATGGVAGEATAQSGAQSAQSEAVIEEVIVTALKRSQNIQDVPASIAALTSEDVEAFRFREPGELAAQVPNLHANSYPGDGTPVFNLRGVYMGDYAYNHNSPIAPYVDEVYKGSPALLAVPFFDLERVEVLRGPQGTLYGRNTTGGAISFISKRPGFEQEGYLTLGAGKYNLREAEGAFNVALSDTVAMRFAGTWTEADGWLKNVLPGVDDAYSIDEHGFRVGVLWQPNDGFEALLRASTAKSSPVNYGFKYDDDGNTPPGTFYGLYGLYNLFGATTLTDPSHTGLGDFEFNSDQDTDRLVETDSVSLTLNWSLSDNYTLTSITSWDDGAALNPDDADGGPPRMFLGEFAVDANQVTQELRLTSNLDGPFNFVTGLYYFREEVDGSNLAGQAIDLDLNIDGAVDAIDCLDPLSIAFGLPPSPAGAATDALFQSFGFSLGDFATFGCYQRATYEQEKTSYAAYFDGSYALSDALTLRFGLRYTDDKGKLRNFNAHYAGNDFTPLIGTVNGGSADPLAIDAGVSQDNSDTELTVRLGIDYAFSNGNLLYASFSQGYRGGSYNTLAYSSPSEANWVEPEYLDSFEVGLKSVWWDGRMRVNAAAFYYDYKDQQALDFDLATFMNRLINFGESEILGGEIEAAVQLTPALSVRLGVGLLDTEVSSGTVNGVDITGSEIPFASDVNINAAIDWDVLRLDAGVLTLHVDGAYRTDVVHALGGAEPADGYTVFNGRITFDASNWAVSLWSKNLVEKKYYTFFLDFSDFYGVPWAYPGPPRTYGAEFTYRF